jgi:hypothetical protein
MLRRTNRLQEHLKSIGYGFYERSVYPENPLFDVREVEFIPPPEGNAVTKENRKRRAGSPDGNTSVPGPSRTLFIPDGFCFWTLERLIKRFDHTQGRNPFFIPLENLSLCQERWGKHIPRFRNWWREDESINIFWLSPTEFVSPLRLHSFENYASYAVEFFFNEKCTSSSKHSSLLLYAYHIDNMKSKGHRTPQAPLQFFKQLVAPVIDRISSIEFSRCEYALSTSTIVAMLSVVSMDAPSNSSMLHRKNDVLRVRLNGNLTDDQVKELVSFPFHPNVRLGFSSSCSSEQCNRFLLQAKYLCHVEIPDKLVDVEGEDKLFVSNPVFQSLTFRVQYNIPSSKLLECISESKTINHLTVQCHDSKDEDKRRILDILRTQCVGRDSSVKEFTIEVIVYSFPWHSFIMGDAQRFFDQWTQYICNGCNKGLARHSGLSSFRFAFSDGRYNPFIKSNPKWDSFLVPSLAMNWSCRQRRVESSPSALDEICTMVWAVRAVNQGSAYRGATNVVPCDLSPSSASVIFDMLVRNAASIVKRQPLA